MIRRQRKGEKPRPHLGDHLRLRWSTFRVVDGLWIGAYFQWNNDEGQGLYRIEQALNLIKAHDPVRYQRLLRDLERVWALMIVGGLGQFDEALSACKIDQRFILDESKSAEQIAATIVHEATHARLATYGISYDEPIRHRIEAICIRREMAFARRLPNGALVWDEAERSLSAYASPDYWTNAAFTERHTTEMVETLRQLGVPSMLIRILLTTLRWRLAASRFLRGFRKEQRA